MEPTNQTTQQLMFSLIEIWKGSGQSQINFCKEKNIAYHRFHYWFKKYTDHTPTLHTHCIFLVPEDASTYRHYCIKEANLHTNLQKKVLAAIVAFNTLEHTFLLLAIRMIYKQLMPHIKSCALY